MVPTRLVRAVLVALSLSATAQAVVIDAAAGDVALVNRQENSSGGGTTPTATPSATQPTTTTTTQPTTTPTTTTPTTTPTTEPTTTPTTAPTTTPATTTGETTTTTNPTTTPPASTTPGPNTSTGGTTSAPPSSTEVSTTVFTTITSTDANGSPTTHTSGIPTKTTLPLAGNTGNNDEAAQANNKNIIIGVCVGVGGAIVLAVAGVLFWRLRNKRRQEVDHDELQSFGTGYGAPSTAEKTEGSNSTRSPFQSTLESYHAPTQTNTASNF